MTLIEAIAHADEVANTCEDERCAEEHRQLAAWLTELIVVKEENENLHRYIERMRGDAE